MVPNLLEEKEDVTTPTTRIHLIEDEATIIQFTRRTQLIIELEAKSIHRVKV